MARSAHTHDAQPARTAGKFRDPVCSMEYDLTQSVGTATHRGVTYNFCSHECMMKFKADPASFVEPRDVA